MTMVFYVICYEISMFVYETEETEKYNIKVYDFRAQSANKKLKLDSQSQNIICVTHDTAKGCIITTWRITEGKALSSLRLKLRHMQCLNTRWTSGLI